MEVSLDTNVLQALLQAGHLHQERAVKLIKQLQPNKNFLLCPVVYSEAQGIPNFSLEVFNAFLEDLDIEIDWSLPQNMWQLAGQAHLAYHQRRRKQGLTEPKRVLADFLIGAHALVRDVPLLTFDPKGYRAAFPNLELLGN